MQLRRYFAMLLAACTGPALAANPPAFEIRDGQQHIILLGSVHLLDAQSAALPEIFRASIDRADRVIFELAPEQLDPMLIQQLAMQYAIDPEGRTLTELISADSWSEIRQHTERAGLPLDALRAFEPWMVLLQLQAFHFASRGFRAEFGIEHQVRELAEARKLATGGLETAEEQLRFFDELPLQLQERYLLKFARDLDDSEKFLRELVDKWRRGDLDGLEVAIMKESRENAEVMQVLLASRNHRWVESISNYLREPGTEVVVVGAAHLVGDEGLPALLEQAGYDVTRL